MTIDSVTPADRQRVTYSTFARSNHTISFNNYLTQEVIHCKLFVKLVCVVDRGARVLLCLCGGGSKHT
jgi:hypothetical protein